jgi:hypothetical protein
MDGVEKTVLSHAQEMNAVRSAQPRALVLLTRMAMLSAVANQDMVARTAQSHAQALPRPASLVMAMVAVKLTRRRV